MSEELSRREYHHTQDVKYKFNIETYSPMVVTNRTTGAKSRGKPTFNVEVMVYITGVGYDIVDVFNSGNELVKAFHKQVQFYEYMGYDHNGLSANEIKNKFENMWETKFE